MSQPSYISSSEAKRYVLIVAATAMLLSALAMAISFLAIHYRWVNWHFAQLYEYQLGKLKGNAPIEVLLVGDSSLGNVIDARGWSERLKRPVVSVALTGVYGHAGSLNMMRRAVRHHKIATIVVVQTIDSMTRDSNDQGLIHTAETLSDLRGLSPLGLFRALATLDIVLHALDTIVKGRPVIDPEIVKSDYVPQGRPLPEIRARPAPGGFAPSQINRSNADWLIEMAKFCRENNVQCVYAFGPISELFCEGSTAYLREVAQIVENSGLRLLSKEPVCIPWERTGDATNHVAPTWRNHYSNHYLSLIEPILRYSERPSATP